MRDLERNPLLYDPPLPTLPTVAGTGSASSSSSSAASSSSSASSSGSSSTSSSASSSSSSSGVSVDSGVTPTDGGMDAPYATYRYAKHARPFDPAIAAIRGVLF